MAADRTKNGNGSAATRSAVTNASKLVMNADGRSAVARRYRDVFSEIASDLGGHDVISEAQRQLVRRAAMLSVYCESVESDMAQGSQIDTDDLVRVVNALTRVLTAIGLQRRPRPSERKPTLTEYLAAQAEPSDGG